MMKRLTANLKLELNYKGEDNKIQLKDISINYDLYFANEGAILSGLVDAASAKIDNIFNKNFYVIINAENKNFYNNEKELEEDIKTKLLATIKKSNNLILQESNFYQVNVLNKNADQSVSNYKQKVYKSSNIMREVITSNLEEQNGINIIKKPLNDEKEIYETNLKQWMENKSIKEEENNIFMFGNYLINDWSISGLRLKAKAINFIDFRKEMNHQEWVDNISKILWDLWNKNGLLKDCIKWKGNDLEIYLNTSDFASLNNNLNKKIEYINDYINDHIKNKIINSKFKDYPFKFGLNPSNNQRIKLSKFNHLNENNSEYYYYSIVNSKDSLNYSYMVFSFDTVYFIAGSRNVSKNIKINKYLAFNSYYIMRANGDVW